MHRSELTIDLGAVRRNVADAAPARSTAASSGRSSRPTATATAPSTRPRAALGAGATALCVATVAEGVALRREFPSERILVLGPAEGREVARCTRGRRSSSSLSSTEIPEGVRVHLKLDTGMGRYGLSELPEPPVEVVGLMTHLATADSDVEFARTQIERFREATESSCAPHAPRREQRGGAPPPRVALRRRPLRGRAVRHVAVRRGCRRGRTRAGAAVAQPRLAREAAPARREHRLRTAVRRRAADVDRDRAGRLRRRLSPRPDRHRRCASRASRERSSAPSRWTRSPSSSSDELPLGTPVVLVGRGVTLEDARAHRGHDQLRVVGAASSADPRRARRVVIDS